MIEIIIITIMNFCLKLYFDIFMQFLVLCDRHNGVFFVKNVVTFTNMCIFYEINCCLSYFSVLWKIMHPTIVKTWEILFKYV
jgi:hypothetical protein